MVMEQELAFKLDHHKPHFCNAIICVPPSYVEPIYQEIAHAQKHDAATHGFGKGATPIEYVTEYYRSNLLEHVKEFLFKYFVISFLYQNISEKKIPVAGHPRLNTITIEQDKHVQFLFDISLTTPIEFREWKNFPFKAPKRKNYKDIDRQVESFIAEEENFEKNKAKDTIDIGDWIRFEIELLNKKGEPLLQNAKTTVWLKIGSEEADVPFQELFVDKKVGERFCTQSICLQEYLSNQLDTSYNFCVHIIDKVEQAFFSFDLFKQHFRLKNNKEMHQKLIEVFSFRNDISQRRSMVEEALRLMLSKHPVDAPHYLILREQIEVLESVQYNPDYQVYKTEPSFKETIKQLAAKQVKETMLIDQLGNYENTKVTAQDIKCYLNLLKRPRTKEFIYFNPPPTKSQGQEMPLPEEILKRNCLREKTLNHLVYHLTRR
jgi:FKBP-type peptidyl-prolyl cis-trans isomerase (trigger factor)